MCVGSSIEGTAGCTADTGLSGSGSKRGSEQTVEPRRRICRYDYRLPRYSGFPQFSPRAEVLNRHVNPESARICQRMKCLGTCNTPYHETQPVRTVESVLLPPGRDRTEIRREIAEKRIAKSYRSKIGCKSTDRRVVRTEPVDRCQDTKSCPTPRVAYSTGKTAGGGRREGQ